MYAYATGSRATACPKVIRLLGQDILEVATGRDASAASPALDRGDCTTQPVGFVARMDRPQDVDLPEWR